MQKIDYSKMIVIKGRSAWTCPFEDKTVYRWPLAVTARCNEYLCLSCGRRFGYVHTTFTDYERGIIPKYSVIGWTDDTQLSREELKSARNSIETNNLHQR